MGNIVEEALEIIRPTLPAALIDPARVPRLWGIAASLVPITFLRIGLECRLGPGEGTVDIQQGFHPIEGEPAILAGHLDRMIASAQGPLHPAWGRIAAFCAAWRDRTAPIDSIVQFWLEFDDPFEVTSTAPSVFLGLHRDLPSDRARAAIETALELLRGRCLTAPHRRWLDATFDACSDHAYVSHIGLMLSRDIDAVRVNVADLRAEQVGDYLDRVAWPGSRAALAAELPWLFSQFDAVTVCLDVGERIGPRIGLEAMLEGGWADRRWPFVLDAFVARGLCTPEKREALASWPRQFDPSSCSQAWPAGLIAAALMRPAEDFGAILQHLSHLKLSLGPTGAVEAKGYFGIGHVWRHLAGDGSSEEPKRFGCRDPRPATCLRSHPSPPPTPAPPAGDPVAAAIHKAVSFLVEARNLGGWWRDFPTFFGGGSDEWITAFVGAALAGVPDRRAAQTARQGWELLANRRSGAGGWGYNTYIPLDADSTAWGLRLAEAIHAGTSELARRARSALESLRLPDGGLTCFRASDRDLVLPWLATPPADGAFGGWSQIPHTCITAAAAMLDDERSRDHLRRAQRDDGRWVGYFWDDDEYTTALAAEALARTGRDDDRRRVQAAVRWASRRLSSDGDAKSATTGAPSAFATAGCLRILALESGGQGLEARRAARWLLDHQREDGSWPASAWMSCPTPEVVDREAEADRVEVRADEARIFTTAFVLPALDSFKERAGRF